MIKLQQKCHFNRLSSTNSVCRGSFLHCLHAILPWPLPLLDRCVTPVLFQLFSECPGCCKNQTWATHTFTCSGNKFSFSCHSFGFKTPMKFISNFLQNCCSQAPRPTLWEPLTNTVSHCGQIVYSTKMFEIMHLRQAKKSVCRHDTHL